MGRHWGPNKELRRGGAISLRMTGLWWVARHNCESERRRKRHSSVWRIAWGPVSWCAPEFWRDSCDELLTKAIVMRQSTFWALRLDGRRALHPSGHLSQSSQVIMDEGLTHLLPLMPYHLTLWPAQWFHRPSNLKRSISPLILTAEGFAVTHSWRGLVWPRDIVAGTHHNQLWAHPLNILWVPQDVFTELYRPNFHLHCQILKQYGSPPECGFESFFHSIFKDNLISNVLM